MDRIIPINLPKSGKEMQRTRPYQRTPQIRHGKERTPTIHQGLPSGND